MHPKGAEFTNLRVKTGVENNHATGTQNKAPTPQNDSYLVSRSENAETESVVTNSESQLASVHAPLVSASVNELTTHQGSVSASTANVPQKNGDPPQKNKYSETGSTSTDPSFVHQRRYSLPLQPINTSSSMRHSKVRRRSVLVRQPQSSDTTPTTPSSPSVDKNRRNAVLKRVSTSSIDILRGKHNMSQSKSATSIDGSNSSTPGSSTNATAGLIGSLSQFHQQRRSSLASGSPPVSRPYPVLNQSSSPSILAKYSADSTPRDSDKIDTRCSTPGSSRSIGKRSSIHYQSPLPMTDDDMLESYSSSMKEDCEFKILYSPRFSLHTLFLIPTLFFIALAACFFIWNFLFTFCIFMSRSSALFRLLVNNHILQSIHLVFSWCAILSFITAIAIYVSLMKKVQHLLRAVGRNMLHLLEIQFNLIEKKDKTSQILEFAVVEHAFFQLAQLMKDWKQLLPQHFFMDVPSEKNADNIIHKLLDYDNFVQYMGTEDSFSDISSAPGIGAQNSSLPDRKTSSNAVNMLVKQSSVSSSINSTTSNSLRHNKVHPLNRKEPIVGERSNDYLALLSGLPFEEKVVSFLHLRLEGTREETFCFFQEYFDTITKIVRSAKATLVSFDESSIEIAWNAFVRTNVHSRLACSTADALLSLIYGDNGDTRSMPASVSKKGPQEKGAKKSPQKKEKSANKINTIPQTSNITGEQNGNSKETEGNDTSITAPSVAAEEPVALPEVSIGIFTGMAHCGVLHRKYMVCGIAKDSAILLSRLAKFWKTRILCNEGAAHFSQEFMTRPLDIVRSPRFPNHVLRVHELGPRRVNTRRFKNWLIEMNQNQIEKRFKQFSQIFEDAMMQGDVEKSYNALLSSKDLFHDDPQAQIFLGILEGIRVSSGGVYYREHIDVLTEKLY